MHPYAREEKRPSVGSPNAGRFRLWAILGLLMAAVSFGCNPATLLYFVFAPDPTFPPGLINLTEKKKDVTVVLLIHHANAENLTDTLFNADQLLAKDLANVLKKRYKTSGDKVTIVAPYKVDEYRARNPSWLSAKTEFEIGKHFKADYVISMEINKLSLYQKGSSDMLYRGRANITVNVTDVNGPREQGPVATEYYSCEFPRHAPEAADLGISAGHFRARFISHMAKELSRYFADYPSNESRMEMGSH